ncbi:GTPases [Candidatus Scalindua japonica]|uniref:GTPases n=1 Tax=Candidatus Scalindua japonica TaxID=1284222 RepID=A0A286TUZ7_9BACT|nr:dynamin family protein [Candidatus Scalindua japonica]GAX59684.1 GTPases [Candidatus Scalindua japonica]
MLEVAKSPESQDKLQHVVELLDDAKKFFYRIGDVEIEKKVSEMAAQINEPLYLVIAGEYNSGKSSFVNALCGKRILKDGPTPSTNKITLLTYGEDVSSEEVDDHQCKMTYPLEALKDLTIVDTPGTNSIIAEHQLITEGFIHRSEVVLFVTSADHPFTESERVFLQLLKGKWDRKLLFVLNKIDLKTEEDHNEIITFIEKNFYRLFGYEPKVISMSTKDAFLAKTSGDEELLKKSNIEKVEQFIFEKMDYDTKMDLKILSPLKYLVNVFDGLKNILSEKVSHCNNEIKSVEMFEKRSNNKRQDMIDYIVKYKTETQSVFTRLKEKVDNFLNYHVNIRSIITMKFAREKIDDKFKREVFGVANPRTELERIINDAIDYVDRNNNVLWDMANDYIESEIAFQRKTNDDSLVRKDRYFSNRESDKHVNLREYAKQFQELDGELEGAKVYRVVQSGFLNFIVLEGLALGIVIGLSTFFIPNTLGIVVASILAGIGFSIFPLKRKKYRNEFMQRVDAICERFNNMMLFEFEKIIDRVLEDIGNRISSYRDTRWSEREEVNRQITELKALSERTKDLIRKSCIQ